MGWTTDPRRWQPLAVGVLLGVLVWLLPPILRPFGISGLLGWLGDPMVGRLERSGRSRAVSVGLVFGMITLVLAMALLVLAPMLWDQVSHLIDSMPRIAAWVG